MKWCFLYQRLTFALVGEAELYALVSQDPAEWCE